MKAMINLANAFIKSNAMSKPTEKGQKIKILILSIFSMVCIICPVLIGVCIMVKAMTQALGPVGYVDFGITLMFYITCVFTVVFGMNILFSELYFVNDIEYVLPFPLRAYEIVGAKFLAVFQMENIMQFMMVMACIIGYVMGVKECFGVQDIGIFNIILGLVGIVFLPIMPLAVCGVVSIILMAFTKIIRNKDVIHKVTLILSFVVLVIVALSVGTLQTLDIGEIIENMAKKGESYFGIIDILIPTVSLYVDAISKGNIIKFLLYIAINIISFLVMLGIGEMLYFKGLAGLTTTGVKNTKRDIDEIVSRSKKRNPIYAYFLKEIRVLLRTPAYLTNCVGVNFIWPIFVYAVYKLKGCSYTLEQLRAMYRTDEGNLQIIVLILIVGVSVLITALNSISSNSFSREGKHFAFIKYIPINYKEQWHVKALVGAMWAVIGVLIYIIPAGIICYIPFGHMMIYITLSIFAIVVVSYIGIYIDSIQPKLVWEDELGSLRENYNTFFTMAIAIGIVIFMCIAGYICITNSVDMYTLSGIIGIAIGISTIIVSMLCKKVYLGDMYEYEEF